METSPSKAPLTWEQASAGNWEEDFTHENGNYLNICLECKNTFRGHKRRVMCKVCFEKEPDWEKIAKMPKPADNKCAHAGCWSEGEMVGYAKCMVEKFIPATSRVQALEEELAKEKLEREREVNYEKISLGLAEENKRLQERIKELEKYEPYVNRKK